jgi:hypothetical protein
MTREEFAKLVDSACELAGIQASMVSLYLVRVKLQIEILKMAGDIDNASAVRLDDIEAAITEALAGQANIEQLRAKLADLINSEWPRGQ